MVVVLKRVIAVAVVMALLLAAEGQPNDFAEDDSEMVETDDNMGDHVDCSTIRQVASPRICDTITLRDVHLGDRSVNYILTALKSNHVKGLFLHNNNLQSMASVHIADAVMNSTSIHALQMTHNKVESHGVEAIAVLLRRSKRLKYLNLNGNFFGDDAAATILNAAASSPSLGHLELAKNDVHDHACKAFRDSLRRHVGKAWKLHNVGLKFNDITNIGVHHLLDVAHENRGITDMPLIGNRKVSQMYRDQLQQALDNNLERKRRKEL